MKIFKSIITLFVLTIAVASCSTDDDTPEVNNDLIVGEWEITDLVSETNTTTTFNGESFVASAIGVGSNFNYTITFNEDNTTTASGSYAFTTTTIIQGEEVVQTTPIEDLMTEGTWSIDGDQLIFTGLTTSSSLPDSPFDQSQDAESSTIVVLNETTLILTSDIEAFAPQESTDSFELSVEGNSTVTLARIN